MQVTSPNIGTISAPLLEVSNLQVYFPVHQSFLVGKTATVKAVDDVSFSLTPGETVGLVGESGCGKTTLGRTIVGLTRPTGGSIHFQGRDLKKFDHTDRRLIQMVFQDPFGSLNPRLTIREIVTEGAMIQGMVPSQNERDQLAVHLLEQVGLSAEHADRYPHEFSGGQRQRIGIARALAVNPRLLVCDEPVSALDVSVQAQIINLLAELRERQNLTLLFIAHDLAVVEHLSHRIMVMYLGRMVEMADARTLCAQPHHPYTRALMAAVPTLDSGNRNQRHIISGDMPSPLNPPPGCPFHPRCPLAESRCRESLPAWRETGAGHFTACHLA